MDRREALAAFLSLPATTRIHRLEAKPESILVLEISGPISNESLRVIKEGLTKTFPGLRCMILGDGMTLKVIDPRVT